VSIKDYVRRVQEVEGKLDSFYNDIVLKRHRLNPRKGAQRECWIIAKHILNLVGGSMDAMRDDNNKVAFGVNLGKFSSKMRLSSLHSSFESYFVQKVSSWFLSFIIASVSRRMRYTNAPYVFLLFFVRHDHSDISWWESTSTTLPRGVFTARSSSDKLTSSVYTAQSAKISCTEMLWPALIFATPFGDTFLNSNASIISSPGMSTTITLGQKVTAPLR